LGLVGVGDIGKRTGRLAHAFGMTVVAYDPFIKDSPFELVSTLSELLSRADVVSVHTPLTGQTKGMIGKAELALMRPTAMLVNTSRGGIVDEGALAEALANNVIRGAGLDVYSTEPPPSDSPLLKLDNLVMTPHVGGSTFEALNSVAAIAADTALQYLDGQQIDPSLCVNPGALHGKKNNGGI